MDSLISCDKVMAASVPHRAVAAGAQWPPLDIKRNGQVIVPARYSDTDKESNHCCTSVKASSNS